MRATAADAYLYAQMASNASPRNAPFDLGPEATLLEAKDNDGIGFAYSVFERRRSNGVNEIVIAYRGTENLTDWFYGNILGKQNRRGLRVYEEWRAKTPKSVRISVTGHSLGGGIATHVSLRKADTDTYIFNASPRFWKGRNRVENKRVSIAEYGEVLKLGRIFGAEADQLYTSIGCVNGPNTFRQHFMRPFAECLTRIAAIDDAGARSSLERNAIPPGQVRKVLSHADSRHPHHRRLGGTGRGVRAAVREAGG